MGGLAGWSTRSEHVIGAATHLSRGVLAGLLAGFVIGGIGGRLAMLLLRLTSDPALRGMKTDDEFIIGRFSADTGFLVAATTLLGGAGGIAYLGAREWLPPRLRGVVWPLLLAVVGGAVVIDAEGIDFTVLEPLWLAVVLFLVLPGAHGLGVSILAERLLARPEPRGRGVGRWLGLLPALFAVLPGLALGPLGLVLSVAIVMALLFDRSSWAANLWRSPPVLWAGRLAMAVLFAFAVLALSRDVTAIL